MSWTFKEQNLGLIRAISTDPVSLDGVPYIHGRAFLSTAPGFLRERRPFFLETELKKP